jgi:capsular polysaccharide biosynthesis protein
MAELNQVSYWQAWQSAMRAKRIVEARRLFAQADRRFAALSRNQTDIFERDWRMAVEWYYNTFNVAAALKIISRAIELHLMSADDLLLHRETAPFVSELWNEFETSRTIMTKFMHNIPVSFPINELVRVISHPKLFLFDETRVIGVAKSWQCLVREVARQAARWRKSICIVHDELKVVSDASPASFTLSYHTTGATSQTLHFKEADLPEYFLLDEEGYAGWSSMARRTIDQLPLNEYRMDEVEDFFSKARNRIITSNYSMYAQPSHVSNPLPDRYVFVALQVATDTVQALAWVSMFEMVEMVWKRFASSGYAVVVKRHPLCRDVRVSSLLERLSNSGSIVLREDSIHRLTANAEAVISVNSSVGSEAAIHLKPIYCFGASEYGAIAHNIHNESQFFETTSPIRPAVSSETMKRFVFYYRNKWLIDISQSARLEAAIAEKVIQPALKLVR